MKKSKLPKKPEKILTAPVTERRKDVHVCPPHEHDHGVCVCCASIFYKGGEFNAENHHCPPHNHGDSCANCRAYAHIWADGSERHVCPPHQHNSTVCQSCMELQQNAIQHIPPLVKWETRTQYMDRVITPWSTHMSWFFFAVIVGAVMFAWGYGPQWNQLAGDHVMSGKP